MPHNPKKNVLVSINRRHHKLLKQVADHDKRGISATNEVIIEEAAAKRNIPLADIAPPEK